MCRAGWTGARGTLKTAGQDPSDAGGVPGATIFGDGFGDELSEAPLFINNCRCLGPYTGGDGIRRTSARRRDWPKVDAGSSPMNVPTKQASRSPHINVRFRGQSGHRLVRRTYPLLTQSGHWSRVRHLESRLNTLKYLTVPTKGLIYSLDSARYRCKSESSRCTGSEKIAGWALGQRCSRCASSWRCRLATFISKTFKHLLRQRLRSYRTKLEGLLATITANPSMTSAQFAPH